MVPENNHHNNEIIQFEDEEFMSSEAHTSESIKKDIFVTKIYNPREDISAAIFFTQEYDKFIQNLRQKYPSRSNIKKNLREIIQAENLKNNFKFFNPKSLLENQLQQFINQYEIHSTIQKLKDAIINLIIQFKIHDDPVNYVDIQIKKFGVRVRVGVGVRNGMIVGDRVTQITKINKMRCRSIYSHGKILSLLTDYQYLIDNNQTPCLKRLSETHSINKDTVYKTIKKYKSQKPIRIQKIGKHSTDLIPLEIKEDILKYSLDPVNIGKTIRFRQQFFSQKYQHQITYQQMRSFLCIDSGFSRRKLHIQDQNGNTAINLLKRRYISILFAQIIGFEGMDILTMDESGFNLNDSLPKYGYQQKGSTNQNLYAPGRGVNHTLICCISFRFGLVSYQFVRGGVNTPIFLNYLKSTINIYNKYYKCHAPILFFDNASIHVKKELIPDLSLFNMVIIWNSPYSPTFSAIEEYFGILKKKIEGTYLKTGQELIEQVIIQMHAVDKLVIQKLYMHSFIRMFLEIQQNQQ